MNAEFPPASGAGPAGIDPMTAEQSANAPDGNSKADLEKQLATALAKAAESQDLYLRARADAENTRRRAQDDISKAHKYALESFAESLVPVMDSLDEALKNEAATAQVLREGIEITRRQLRSAFERGRLIELDPAGQKFDPHRHQAISMVPAADGMAANCVVTVLQKGWLIADRVLRPALVTVSQPSSSQTGSDRS